MAIFSKLRTLTLRILEHSGSAETKIGSGYQPAPCEEKEARTAEEWCFVFYRDVSELLTVIIKFHKPVELHPRKGGLGSVHPDFV